MSIEISSDMRLIVEMLVAVIAIVTFMAALVERYRRVSEDPYLIYYITAAFVLLPCVWLSLRFTDGEDQTHAAQFVFGLTGIFTVVAVVWRYLIIWAYERDPDNAEPPGGFSHEGNMLPYFLLIGATLIMLVLMVFIYTADDLNQSNRMPILVSLGVLVVWGSAWRLVWQALDSKAKRLLGRGQGRAE